MVPQGTGQISRPLGATCLLLACTAALTWPLPVQLTTHLPRDVDAYFGAWRLAWIADALASSQRVFDAPIFFPQHATLALSDSILLTGAWSAPLRWVGLSAITVYNVVTLFAILAAGLAVLVLGATVTRSWAAGAIGGIVYALNPHRMEHLERIELLMTAAVPLMFLFWHHAIARRSRALAMAAGLMIAVQWYSGMYVGLFLACVAPALLLELWWTDVNARVTLASGLCAGIAASALLISLAARPYLEARAAVGARELAEVRQHSAELKNFVAVHPRNQMYGDWLSQHGTAERHLFPGAAAIALASVGLLVSSWRVRAVYLAVAIVALVLALGANMPLFTLLREWVLPFRSIRAPVRAANVLMLALAMFAAIGYAHIVRTWRPSRAALCAAAVGLLLVAEYRMQPNLEPVAITDLGIARSAGLDAHSVLLEFPVATPEHLARSVDGHYMLDRIGLWPRLINGYSGHYPYRYTALLGYLRTFPDRHSLRALVEHGATHIAVHERFLHGKYADVMQALSSRHEVTLAATYQERGGEVAIFKVGGAGPLP